MAAVPYIIPFAVYLLFLAAEQSIAGSVYVLYPIKTLAVAAALAWAWRGVRDDLRAARGLPFGALIGVLAFGVWIAPEVFHLTKADFTTGSFNPLVTRHSSLVTCFRLIGAVLVVPVMEELFWRGWLLRWLVKEDFRSVPLGTFTWGSFAIATVFFGLEHGALWHIGMITGALYNLVLYRTRSLWACIVAHATTNLLLGVYVLVTGKWGYW